MLWPQIVELTPIDNYQSGATGFQLVSPSGAVVTVTNAHVCEMVGPSGQMMAHLDDGSGTERVVHVREISRETDLCVLDGIAGKDGLRLARDFNRRKKVFVLGHPHLEPLTLSSGYWVATKDIEYVADLDAEHCKGGMYHAETARDFLGTDTGVCIARVYAHTSSAVIYPGNSGSPALDSDGQVIGVMFAGYRETNFGTFVPLEDLKKFLKNY